MLTAPRGRRVLLLVATAALCAIFFLAFDFGSAPKIASTSELAPTLTAEETYLWRTLPTNYPPDSIAPLPTNAPKTFPRIQAKLEPESAQSRKQRVSRQAQVKAVFEKSWTAYKKHAWLHDEVKPVTGGSRDPFGGWAASLVDSLDTLWIMNLKDDFAEAVDAIAHIDFTKTTLAEINVFETTIRYLGGFLSAYDLSQDIRLLRKAVEVGDLIYKSFDTPNRMPVARWNITAAISGEKQVASTGTLVAEIGSLCMELTRLSQITRDSKWFDAAHRITEIFAAQQDTTELPGLWPLSVNAKDSIFNQGSTFTLGAMADSLYEYLPKMTALTGGQLPIYQTMYEKAMNVAPRHLFYKPMTPTNEDILVSSAFHTKDGGAAKGDRETQGQHLVCFLGGVLAIGSKLFNRPQDLQQAERLAQGCVYAYQAFPHKVMPETWHMAACETSECAWNETSWKNQVVRDNSLSSIQDADAFVAKEELPQGFTHVPDKRYILRPEALESVFILYRVTGKPSLADTAWEMFEAIEAATRTNLANSAVWDVTKKQGSPPPSDSMESFWMGETLKYAYLVFSEPGVVSLDEWVFNTEAHPFKRLTRRPAV